MGLLNTTAFEKDDTTVAVAAAAAPTATTTTTTTAAAAPTAAKSAAASTAATRALATASPATALTTEISKAMTVMESFKNVLEVDYNTLVQVIANQGNFIDREAKIPLGDELVFELLSYQDSFVVSPENDDAPDDMVRYSKDGTTCSDGTAVQEHLDWLKTNGFPEARLKQRVVVVGAVETAAKTEAYNGTLVQFDLSPASRVLWNRYLANAAYGLRVGKFTQEQIKRVRAKAKLATRGTDSFTQAEFSVAA